MAAWELAVVPNGQAMPSAGTCVMLAAMLMHQTSRSLLLGRLLMGGACIVAAAGAVGCGEDAAGPNGGTGGSSLSANGGSSSSNNAASTAASGGSGTTTGTGGGGAGSGEGISAQYPGDVGIENHPSVLFHSDFEDGLNGFDSYTQDTSRLSVVDDAALANGGTGYLRASVTRAQLANNPYISTQARVTFAPQDEIYWRLYARFVGNTAPPHHWVRTIALNDTFSADGQAGIRPAGNAGFWYDFDVRTDDTFKFYTYWQEMRSWMCNDGSTNPGCAGYNGPSQSAYYGNNFHYDNQTPFARDAWFCLELHGKANTVGANDGAIAFWHNGVEAARYETGGPNGRWLRENFYSHGQYYQDDGPFEGFNFRSDTQVGWRLVVLDAYYQKDTLDNKEANGYPVQEVQTILYDDVVVATERIGCKQ